MQLAPDVSLAEVEKAIPWGFTPADVTAVVKAAQLDAVRQLFGEGPGGLPADTDVPLAREQATETAEQASGANKSNMTGGRYLPDRLTAETRLGDAHPSQKVCLSRLNLLNALATAKPSMTSQVSWTVR